MNSARRSDGFRLGAEKASLEELPNHDRCGRQRRVMTLEAEPNEHEPIGAASAHGICRRGEGGFSRNSGESTSNSRSFSLEVKGQLGASSSAAPVEGPELTIVLDSNSIEQNAPIRPLG